MVTLVLLGGGAALVSILAATAALGRSSTSTFLLGSLGAYLILVHSLVLLTGLAGFLTPLGAGAALTAAFAVAAWRLRRGPSARDPGKGNRQETAGTPDLPAPGPGSPGLAPLHCYPMLAAIAAGALWTWPHLWGATRLWIWDDYTYHMVYPALWLREHAIAAVDPAHAFTMQAWYPLGASVVATWFMLPAHGLRGDGLAWVSLTGPLYAGIIAAGTAALLARLGCRPGAWALPVVLLATSSRVAVMASSFSDADLAMAAALFAAFVFAVPRGDGEEPADLRVDAWYAGLLSGVALGIKVSAMVPAAIVLAMALARAAGPARGPDSASGTASGGPMRSGRAARGLRVALAFAVSWAATGGYWYARNAIHTGNPVYPAAFLTSPGSTFPETTLAEYARRWGVGKAIVDAAAVYMNWPLLHAAAAAAGLGALGAWLVWRRRRLTRPIAYFGLGTLAITGALVLLLPATPYSAGNAMTFRAGFVHWDSMRYVALLPILGWAALGFLLDAGPGASARPRAAAPHAAAVDAAPPGAVPWRAPAAPGARESTSAWKKAATVILVSAALATSPDLPVRPSILIGALALAALIAPPLAARWPARWPLSPARRAWGAAGLVIVLAAFVLWRHDAKAAATTDWIYRERLFGGAAAALDVQPAGSRVAVFGDQWVFPTFGARAHLMPIRLDGDGRVATAPIADGMEPGPLAVDRSTFADNLRAAGVRVVVVVHLPHPGRSAEWPPQETALEQQSRARLAYRGEGVAVWVLDDVQASRSPTSR